MNHSAFVFTGFIPLPKVPLKQQPPIKIRQLPGSGRIVGNRTSCPGRGAAMCSKVFRSVSFLSDMASALRIGWAKNVWRQCTYVPCCGKDVVVDDVDKPLDRAGY